jgi:superfamily I DNA/RNA helicase
MTSSYSQLSLFRLPQKTTKVKKTGHRSHPFSMDQQRIFNQIKKNNQSVLIQAVAGAGKTTTLLEISRRIDGTVLFCAFNKHIADEIQKKVQKQKDITVTTIHAHGRRALGNCKVNSRKYLNLIYECTKALLADQKFLFPALFTNLGFREANVFQVANQWLRDVVSLGQSYLARGSEILKVLEDNNKGNLLINEETLIETYDFICEQGANSYLLHREVDFIDMIWLPNYLGLTSSLPKYDAVLIDEVQDLNKAQAEIALNSVKPGGQIVGAGDPHQSIYGFAGADLNSMENFIKRTGAMTLPLNTCYRCPVSHIKLAQKYNPNIRPGKTEIGEVLYWSLEEYYKNCALGDLVISRKTAPVVALALELIARNIPCRIKGREIAHDMIQIINLTAPDPPNIITHIQRIKQFFDQLNKANNNNHQIIAQNNDKYLYISAILMANQSKSLPEIIAGINKLFAGSELNQESICLSTVHRAKGLEAERVVILNPQDMPMLFPNSHPSQIQQEQNLLYVAHTRAKKTLIFTTISVKKSELTLPNIWQIDDAEMEEY